MSDKVVIRYESVGGRHWAELIEKTDCWFYKGNDSGGTIYADTEKVAIQLFLDKVEGGYFLPDNAVKKMVRVK